MLVNTKAFRKYYNDHMHSELSAFDKRRKRVLFAMFLGVLLFLGLSIYVFTFKVFALSVFLVLPWIGLFSLYNRWIQHFKATYKPLVVASLLKFIDHRLAYYHDECISKDTFLRSGIFPINPHGYKGEDYILGKIGEISFEMSELRIHHTSKIRSRYEKWFDGIFFHVNFNTDFKGQIVIIPRIDRQHFIPTLKAFTKYGGAEIKDTGNPTFDEDFLVFAAANVYYKEMLTPELIDAIHAYHQRNGKKVYASFVDSHFYMAISEPYDLLEVNMFRQNMNFELIASYYQELSHFTRIVRDFDIQH